jgi:hypothetical protein
LGLDLLVFNLCHYLTENTVQTFPEISYSCFMTTIVIDDIYECCISNIDLFIVNIVFLEPIFSFQSRYDVVLSNLDFLNRQVSWDLDNFDSVQQRL